MDCARLRWGTRTGTGTSCNTVHGIRIFVLINESRSGWLLGGSPTAGRPAHFETFFHTYLGSARRNNACCLFRSFLRLLYTVGNILSINSDLRAKLCLLVRRNLFVVPGLIEKPRMLQGCLTALRHQVWPTCVGGGVYHVAIRTARRKHLRIAARKKRELENRNKAKEKIVEKGFVPYKIRLMQQ